MDKSFSLSDLTSFDKLIAPKVLRIVYWIGLAGIALAFLGAIYNALSMMSYSFVGALIALVTAVLVCAFAVLFWRIIIDCCSGPASERQHGVPSARRCCSPCSSRSAGGSMSRFRWTPTTSGNGRRGSDISSGTVDGCARSDSVPSLCPPRARPTARWCAACCGKERP